MTTSLCSTDWDTSDVPAWGTAKDARVIVAVEVAGSWGRDAVGETGYEAPDGATLYLVRSPGRHARTPDERTVLVSGGFDAEPWVVSGRLADADVDAFLSGDVTDEERWRAFDLRPSPAVLLVCTNGRRDACCAVRGRPVAQAAHEAAPGQVWEVSHIGGHRFAPTAIHLPSGQTFGRLTPADAATLVTTSSADHLEPELFSRTKHRGRTDLSPAQRVAETWWREQHDERRLEPPLTIGAATRTDVGERVALPDGTTLLVTTHEGPMLRDSCLKKPKASSYFDAAACEGRGRVPSQQ